MNRFHFGTLAILIFAAGCGGSGSRAFYSSTATSGNPNGAPPAAKYSAPVLVNGSHFMFIIAASPNGHLVGYETQFSQAMYWDTPISTPVPLLKGVLSSAIPTGVNNAGQVVGYANGYQTYVPLYWPNSTATAVPMAIPSGEPDAQALGINASGQIVGASNDDTNQQAIFWNTPSATPQVLSGIGGGSPRGRFALRISNDGHVFGASTSGVPLAWTSHSANATALALPSGDYFIGYANDEMAINPETAEVGGGANGTAIVPVFWSTSQALASPPFPAGYTDSVVLLGIGPNHQSVGIAGTTNSIGVLWTSPTTPFKDLNTMIPTGSGWSIKSAAFMLDDGSIIGQSVDASNLSSWYWIHPSS